jgi:Flp pilus assembly protein TadD
LLDLERPHDAYRHLRYYTEITPANAWAWCYRGRAAEAIGENDEARSCYERSVELAPAGEDATDAGERLDSL